jgi:vacuolar-type H+-ATPase subunit H
MDMLDHINNLEDLVAHAKRVPVTGRAMIDADRLIELIDQMRLAVPRNVQEASEVLDRREQIISQTMLDARRVRASAESEARTLVDESELTRSAKKRSDEIVAEGEEHAARLLQAAEVQARKKMAGVDQYAQESLAQLEEQLLNVLNSIHAGQRVLTPANEIATAVGARAS